MRRSRRLLRTTAVGALAAAALGATAGAAGAATDSGILPGSRITAGEQVQATEQRGDTLYLGGPIALGLRAAGVAAVDPTTGVLDRGVPELVAGSSADYAFADRVVADRDAGVYVLGASTQGGSAPSAAGAPLPSNWTHLDASGAADASTALRFTDDGGAPAAVRDVTVSTDGTTYVSGSFTKVDGQPRAGLAAIDADGALTAWAPALDAGRVERLYAAGSEVLLVGNAPNGGEPTFSAVGGQPRSGLALVSGDTGAPRSWAPAGLTQDDAQMVAVDGSSVFLASNAVAPGASDARGTVRAVGLAGTGAVRDLGVDADGIVEAIAARSGALYVTGSFTRIGSQATQPSRSGLAQLDPATGAATAWNPPAQPGAGPGLAVTDDAVYVGGGRPLAAETACSAAYSRTTAQRTAWSPRLGQTDGACGGALSLTASDGRIWAAGTFTAANTRARDGLAAIDVRRDEILDWAPEVTNPGGTITDLELSPDGTTMYVAADSMTALNGVPRLKVGAVATTGAGTGADAVRPWDPAPNDAVVDTAVSQDGSAVYLGGSFTTLDGVDRPRLAATAATTGAPTAWRPAPTTGTVNAIELAGDGTIYVGGDFTQIGTPSVGRQRLAAFAGQTDAPTAWAPQSAGTINDLALGADVVYAGGVLNNLVIGGQTRRGAAALDRTTGAATSWNPTLNGNVGTVSTTADGTVYLLGTSSGGFTSAQGRSRPSRMTSVTPEGTVTGWAPGTGSRPVFALSAEVREASERVFVPGTIANGFDGVPQAGFLGFGVVTKAPVATAKPTVLGRRTEGGTLTCRAGTYAGGSITRSYAWLRDGVAIDGQTGVTYTVRDADVAKRLSCRETAENAVGPTSTDSDSVLIVQGVPVNNSAPAVTGNPQVGQSLTCTEGFWDPVPSTYRYAWLRDGAPIDGATGATYRVSDADVGKALRCQVRGVNDAGTSPAASSAVLRVPAPPVEDPDGPDTPGGPDGPGGPNDPGNPPTPPPGPTPPGPTPPVPGPKPPTPAATPEVSVSAKAVGAKGRRITLTVSPSAAGRVTVSAATGKGRRRVTVGSGSATAKKAGTLRITVKPSAKGRKALRAGRTATVTFKVTFTRADGVKVTVTKTLKVKIRR